MGDFLVDFDYSLNCPDNLVAMIRKCFHKGEIEKLGIGYMETDLKDTNVYQCLICDGYRKQCPAYKEENHD